MVAYYSIRIDDIPHDGFRLVTRWDAAALEGVLEDTDRSFKVVTPLELAVQFHLSGTQVMMDGSCSASLELACVRCLRDFDWPLEARFRYVFWPKSKEPQVEEKELRSDELDVIYYREGETIDLRPLVAEQVYLHMPQYPHCIEACRGICPGCGCNLNETNCTCAEKPSGETASPFSVLKKLKKK